MIKLNLIRITTRKDDTPIFSQTFGLTQEIVKIIFSHITKYQASDPKKRQIINGGEFMSCFINIPIEKVIPLTTNIIVKPIPNSNSVILETVRGEQKVNVEQLALIEDNLSNIRELLEGWEAIINQGNKVKVIAVFQGQGHRARFRGKINEVRRLIETHFKDILATEEYDKSSFTELIDLINPILQNYIPRGHKLLPEALQPKNLVDEIMNFMKQSKEEPKNDL